MGERVVAPSAGLQRSYVGQPRIVEVIEPARDQSITEINDNQSTTPSLPPVADEKVAPGASQAVSGEQLAQLSPTTNGQASLSDDDKILPSGAHFNDPFIDPLLEGLMGPLPHGSLSLGQFGDPEEGAGLGDSFATFSGPAPSQQTFSVPTPTFAGSGAPVVDIPAPGGATTQVSEAGLGPRGNEPAGSQAGKVPTTTQPGLINFTSPGARRRTCSSGMAPPSLARFSSAERNLSKLSMVPCITSCGV